MYNILGYLELNTLQIKQQTPTKTEWSYYQWHQRFRETMLEIYLLLI